jgi:hypothetical protein
VKPTSPSIAGVTKEPIRPEAIRANKVVNSWGLENIHALSLSLNAERSSSVNSILGKVAWLMTLRRSPVLVQTTLGSNISGCLLSEVAGHSSRVFKESHLGVDGAA